VLREETQKVFLEIESEGGGGGVEPPAPLRKKHCFPVCFIINPNNK